MLVENKIAHNPLLKHTLLLCKEVLASSQPYRVSYDTAMREVLSKLMFSKFVDHFLGLN